MPKYMVTGSYSLEGLQGVLKEGGSGRLEATTKLIEAAGGTVESYYFTFGEDDFVLIADMPDNATIAGLSMAVAATGAVSPKTTVLLTPEEVDAAAKVSVSYRQPGH
jgi:uncharacterized protein with GYD domain